MLTSVGGVSSDAAWVLAGACRTLGYVGLVLSLGYVIFAVWVLPEARLVRRGCDLAGAGAALVALTTVLTPYAVAGGPGLDTLTGRQVLLSGIRLGIVLPAAAVLLIQRSALRPLRRLKLVTLFAGSALILTYVLLSDAWGGPLAAVKIVATYLHLAATATWLGGLAALLLVVLPIRGVRGMSDCFEVFSPLAAGCVAVLVVSGLVHAAVVLGDGGVADTGSFVIALLVKSALVGLMLLLANIGRSHHRRVRRNIDLSQHSEGVLAAGIGAELTCGVVVLIATALLVSFA